MDEVRVVLTCSIGTGLHFSLVIYLDDAWWLEARNHQGDEEEYVCCWREELNYAGRVAQAHTRSPRMFFLDIPLLSRQNGEFLEDSKDYIPSGTKGIELYGISRTRPVFVA